MATVIDALVVELGLDASKFTPTQKAALAQLRQFQQEAVKSGNVIESEGKRFESFFRRLKIEAVGLAAGFFGARGMKDFVTGVTNMDAAVGRASKTLNMSTKELSAWQGVARQSGSTSEEMTGALQTMSGEMNKVLLGMPTNLFPILNELRVSLFDTSGKLKTAGQMFFDLSRAIDGMDPARARVLLSSLGLPEGVINTLLIGKQALRDLYDDQVKLGLITQEDADAAIKLQTAWDQAATAAVGLGRSIVSALSPALTTLLEIWTKIFTEFSQGVFISPDSLLGRILGRSSQPSQSTHEALTKRFGPSPLEQKPAGPAPPAAPWFRPGATPTAPLGFAPTEDRQPLRVSPTAGADSAQTRRIKDALTGMDEINRVTSTIDAYHALLGYKSAHNEGRALDLTLKPGADREAAMAAIRRRLEAAGITGAKVEFHEPGKPGSGHSTAPHVHIQVPAPAAPAASPGPLGAPAAAGTGARSSVDNSRGPVSNNFNMGGVAINVAQGDADSIARGLEPALRRVAMIAPANSGAV